MRRFRALLFCLILAPGFAGFGQKKLLAEADKAFNEGHYSEANALYQQAYDKTKDRNVLLKLGESHYLNENYPQAQRYFSEYFRDTVFENIPQFNYYARSSKLTGKLELAVKLAEKLFQAMSDESLKLEYSPFKYYLDHVQFAAVHDLDAQNYCVGLDASKFMDSVSADKLYMWDLGGGIVKEGSVTEHCFDKPGEYRVTLSAKNRATDEVKNKDSVLTVSASVPAVTFTCPAESQKLYNLNFGLVHAETGSYIPMEYIWDMGNGDKVLGKKIKYRYNNSGEYQVKLTVVGKSTYTGNMEMFSSTRKISIRENYETPSKKFSDALNESK